MAFPSTGSLDTFSGGDETPIATNWSGPIYPGIGQLRRLSNKLAPDASAFGGSWFDLGTYGPDCEVYFTLDTVVTSQHIFIYLRGSGMNTINLDGYVLGLNIGNSTRIYYEVDGDDTGLSTNDTSTVFGNGDKVGFRAVGNSFEAWRQPSAGSWTQLLTTTDPANLYPSAGYIAVAVDSGSIRMSAMGGGNIAGQTLVPDADLATGGWTTAPLYSKVNDASDATLITATAS